MDKQGYFRQWYQDRGSTFVIKRARNLVSRYHLTPGYALRNAEECVGSLNERGCPPSLPTPGIILKNHPKAIGHLQDLGAELTVHGYQHLDFRRMEVSKAVDQLVKARRVYQDFDVAPRGFRCPYLGWSEGLLQELPTGLFDYSSNKTVSWYLPSKTNEMTDAKFYLTLENFYRAESSERAVNLPYSCHNFVEIPVSVPDDLQLFDGFGQNQESIGDLWVRTLDVVHQRGEHFNLIFHPELYQLCANAYRILLDHARNKLPSVWMAKLCDISEWWLEKKSFETEMLLDRQKTRIIFRKSPRATVLVKGLSLNGQTQPWDAHYQRFVGDALEVPNKPLPFIGISGEIPAKQQVFLTEQGYILLAGEKASHCSLQITPEYLSETASEVELIHKIETCPGPLVRFWRWPDGAKCALSLTGDLDALSLVDYATRLFIQ